MNYFKYLYSEDEVKTLWLLQEARRDHFFLGIIRDLKGFGFEIEHSLWEGNGMYMPYALSVNSEHYRDEFFKQVADGEMKAQFRLSKRHGPGAALFHFMHELVHFWQDVNGFFIYPVRIEGKDVVQLDLPSQIAVHKLCEAMAAVESIRGALRMREAGFEQAWRGAMSSLNWRPMARLYARNFKNKMPEEENAELLVRCWYASTQNAYCEKLVRAEYQALPPQYERAVDFKKLIHKAPPYFKRLEDRLLADANISSGYEGHDDVQIGTLPYLWKELIGVQAYGNST